MLIRTLFRWICCCGVSVRLKKLTNL